MTLTPTAQLIVQLGDARGRAQGALALARAVGADNLLLLVRDPTLGVLLPAQGLPQTLRGGELWRAFVASCPAAGRHAGEVDLPVGTRAPALALATPQVAAVFLGGAPSPAALDHVECWLPLLAAALHAEQDARIAQGDAQEAQRASQRAEALARALEDARAEQARLNAELRAEHRRKDEFLAMLAHELRNPLAPLLNAVELMRHGACEAAGQERMLEIAHRQIGQLIRLVGDLLDVSRVSRGHIELRREHLLLGDTLKLALEASQPLLAARHHEVSLSLPPEPVPVFADGARLTQVFSNLLHNAAKYTNTGGRIAIALTLEGSHAEVRVRDNGVGIAAHMLGKVFDLFTQAHGSLGRADGGLGIGLTLVRSLVELHGGEVSAHSDGPGTGSTFVVRLPLAAALGGEPARDAQPTPAAGTPLRVMLVDDNQDAADALAAMLRADGHYVEVAYSGAAVLQSAADLNPDIVFLDLGLPELDGYQVALHLRRSLRRQARLVALTGYGSDEDKRRTREAGFHEHAVKPISREVLAAILQRAVKHGSNSDGVVA